MENISINTLIRTATAADLPQLQVFLQHLVDAERPFDPTLKQGELFYYNIGDMLLDSATEVLVAEYNNQLIGCGYSQMRSTKEFQIHDTFGYIGFMFVTPEYRGQGISSLLLNHLKQWLVSKGINELKLDVYEENTAAIRAYEKAGFKRFTTTMRIEI
ncbi:GNAT family N-acetyltransferase [Flavobacterium sp. HSC-61S13]|uniref:GNAT family N-acetyltransferase n=1 Tax=Flavobacterium sp. HSC-61S13 TaxID=2910963 RepID=UPI00209EDD7A|nr:GNAT family N-acetyltransferase [Flavobacterium sp. HSC-61S13]MCP1997048.1 ribosomal protein S18 acetylase RimI-like enzyme [Flavobacterium sp. HSC-61S13]